MERQPIIEPEKITMAYLIRKVYATYGDPYQEAIEHIRWAQTVGRTRHERLEGLKFAARILALEEEEVSHANILKAAQTVRHPKDRVYFFRKSVKTLARQHQNLPLVGKLDLNQAKQDQFDTEVISLTQGLIDDFNSQIGIPTSV